MQLKGDPKCFTAMSQDVATWKLHVCNQCDCKAATKQQIEIHKQTKHEGITYS